VFDIVQMRQLLLVTLFRFSLN